MTSAPSLRLPLAIALAALAACMSAGDYEREADRAVERILDAGTAASLAGRRESVAYPEPAPAQETTEQALEQPRPETEALVLTLEDALAAALRTGRDYVTQKESLYLTALSYSGTRNGYSPQLSALLSYAFADGTALPRSQSAGASAGVTQVLPWGADLDASLSSSSSIVDGDDRYSSGALIRYSQPLLRGAGHAIFYEPLIQAERNVIYALREFERFRESYSIDVARRYYDLVEQEQSLDNQRRTLDRLVFGRRQAEARFQMGEIQEVEVLRARRSELSGQNDLLSAEAELDLALDRFRVFLGLGDDVRIAIVPTSPEFVPVDYDVDSAAEVALQNRLDYLTERDQLVDAERALNIARNALQGSLDVNLSYGAVSDPVPRITSQGIDAQDWSAGLSYDLPLNRVAERNGYRAAQIAQTRARRDFDQFEDSLVVDLRNRFRSLRRTELSLEIQRQSIHSEERNLIIAQLLFERGENSNRDVVEAQESLLLAQNALVREQVSYEIERLNLLRDMGILFIDENGMWTQ